MHACRSTLEDPTLDLNDTPLSGALDVAWSLDDETIATIVSGQGSGRVRVDGLAAGTANLTATVGELTVTIPLIVDPELDPTTTATEFTTGDATTTLTTGTDGATTTATTGPDTGTDTGTTAETTTDTTAGTTGTTTDTTGGAL